MTSTLERTACVLYGAAATVLALDIVGVTAEAWSRAELDEMRAAADTVCTEYGHGQTRCVDVPRVLRLGVAP